MLKVAYLANEFPSPVEPYVGDEIAELRSRGVQVISGSVRTPGPRGEGLFPENEPDVVLQSLTFGIFLRAAWLCLRRWRKLSGLIVRVICRGYEGPIVRIKALLHTSLGACYAVLLAEHEVDHIHAHHGYFGSWIAMTAARLLNVGFSMTLHGSDLLVHASYLDSKLENCSFCLTISEYNRRYIVEQYPQIDGKKIVVSRLGVEIPPSCRAAVPNSATRALSLLSVGRLHAVKDHAFLIRSCAQLRTRGLDFECLIAGNGPERSRLDSLIRRLGLERHVTLLGHVEHKQMDSLYGRADIVVLTSRSEGIPLVLMEAMAREKIVLAPAMTGIPELIFPGKNGFLYQPGSMGDFLAQVLLIQSLLQAEGKRDQEFSLLFSLSKQLDWMRHAARVQILHNHNRAKNLATFADLFIRRITPRTESALHEDTVLQQIQLPIQRNRGLPLRTDEIDEVAGTRSRAVLDV